MIHALVLGYAFYFQYKSDDNMMCHLSMIYTFNIMDDNMLEEISNKWCFIILVCKRYKFLLCGVINVLEFFVNGDHEMMTKQKYINISCSVNVKYYDIGPMGKTW